MSVTVSLTQIDITIKGLPPGLLMASKRIMEAPDSGKKGARRSPQEEAELHCHWTGSGKGKSLAIPWVNVYKSICAAAGQFKWTGRKMMSEPVAATISCETDMIPLGTADYEVYQEWCRIPPRTGAMVKVARPRLVAWQASFVMIADDELYKASMLEGILKHAGKMVGIGPWRPQLKGPYGRFTVERFKIR